MITMEKEAVGRLTVIESVQKRLQDCHPGGAILKVLPEGVRQEEDYWYVAVQPDKELSSRYDYYTALAEVETEMLLQEDVLVLMVPTPAESLTHPAA